METRGNTTLLEETDDDNDDDDLYSDIAEVEYEYDEEDYEGSSDDSLHFSNSVSTFFKNLNCLKDR